MRTDGSYVVYGYDNDGQLQSAVGTRERQKAKGRGQKVADQPSGARTKRRAARETQATERSVFVSWVSFWCNFPAGPEARGGYDSNGNQTGTNNCTYGYDLPREIDHLRLRGFRVVGEGDRTALVPMQTPLSHGARSDRMTSITSGTAYQTLFTYDGLGRLRIRQDNTWNGSSWVLSSQTWYIYDGRRNIQERDGTNTPQVSYTRGAGREFQISDFRFQILGPQVVTAAYRYDPFGNTFASSGGLASVNVYRFSSKMVDRNSGIYYYGYRHYDPNLQRWLNRDPIGERGGINLYGFVSNEPMSRNDPFGLATVGGAGDTKVVSVSNCEIVKVLDEGCRTADAYRFIFPKDPSKGPSLAGFQGCFADNINQRVKQQGHLLDGSPLGPPWNGEVSPYTDKSAWIAARDEMARGAQNATRGWLEQGFCKAGVTITIIGRGGKEYKHALFTKRDVDQVFSWMISLDKRPPNSK